MENFNYSCIFFGSPENIIQLEDYLKRKDEGGFIEDGNVLFINLEYFINNDNNLTLFFDCSINNFKWLKKISKQFKLNFKCNISEGIIFGNYFAIRIFRSDDNIDKTYVLKDKHYSKVEIKRNDDEDQYIYNGKEYDSSDVPLVICEDIVIHEYGKEIISFN